MKIEHKADSIVITVKSKQLKMGTERLNTFWDPERDAPGVEVTDPKEWLKSVYFQLIDEGEDGSNLVTRMLDDAIERAIENGEEGAELIYDPELSNA